VFALAGLLALMAAAWSLCSPADPGQVEWRGVEGGYRASTPAGQPPAGSQPASTENDP
jgi:hypothetical protein